MQKIQRQLLNTILSRAVIITALVLPSYSQATNSRSPRLLEPILKALVNRSVASENGKYTIEIPEGSYKVNKPISLDDILRQIADGSHIELKGSANKKTIITGGKVYWARIIYDANELPQRIQKNRSLVVIEDPELFKSGSQIYKMWIELDRPVLGCSDSYLQLFHRGQRLTCAKWPNKNFARSKNVLSSDPKNGSFEVPVEKATIWSSGPGALTVSGYFGVDWLYESVNVKRVNLDGTIYLKTLSQKHKLAPGLRYRVSGAAEDLDAPGEYIIDFADKKIYIVGYDDYSDDLEYQISDATTLFVIKNRQNITINNIVFTSAAVDGIKIINGTNIRINNCKIEHVGNVGVDVRGGRSVLIDKTLVQDTGGSGIVLKGGDRKLLEASEHVIRRSVVSETSAIFKTYHAAVSLEGVGNTVENSIIHGAPHIGIYIVGNDNKIRYNEIYDVVNETSDAGAIYGGRDWSQRGNVVEGNYVHDILPLADISMRNDRSGNPVAIEVKGVYLDDLYSGTIIRSNIFLNVQKPVFIGGGRDNIIRQNLFINSKDEAVFIDDRGMTWPSLKDLNGVMYKRLYSVPYNSPLYNARYPQLSKLLSENPEKPIGNLLENNVFIGEKALKTVGHARNLVQIKDSIEFNKLNNIKDIDDIYMWITKQKNRRVRRALKNISRVLGQIKKNRRDWSGP